MFAYKNILVPVDFSPVSQRSINRAQEIAAQYQAQLTLLHIVEDIPLGVAAFGDVGAVYMSPDTQDVVKEAAQKQLTELAQEMQLGTEIKLKVIDGYANTSINDYAEDHHIDLIVIGHSAKSGFLGMLMGSTAETVAKHAKCDVLVMRIPKEEAQTTANR
ncbi:MAG: universal stress protein [Thiolinea sp.]